MNKRAQFFIIAALILAGIILTFGKVYTSSKTQTDNLQVYDLSNQIQYEASQVIDNGVYNDKPFEETRENLKNISLYYGELNPDSNIYILYGNSTDISLIEYNLTSRSVDETQLDASLIATASTGGASFELQGQKIKVTLKTLSGNDASKAVSHELDVDQNQVFYIIVRKAVKDQDVIIYR